MTKSICISGYYGFDNFGDELILKILTENIKQFEPNSEITVFSSNPEKTAKNLNVNSIKSFNLPLVIKSLYKCNTLISGGGSLLQDVTGKKSLIYYLGIIALAKLFKKRVIIYAQGLGPICDNFLRKLTWKLLKTADYITVRDVKSQKMLQEQGIGSVLCSDPVWNLNIDKSEKNNKIGIQLRDYKKLNNQFLLQLAEAVNKFYSDKEICILSLQNSYDMAISEKFKNYLLKLNPQINVKIIKNNSNDEIINEISTLDELTAMRYHACLVAIKAGVKLLPIVYDIKVENIANEFDLNTIDMNSSDKIVEKIEKFYHAQIQYNQEKINKLKFDFKELIQNI